MEEESPPVVMGISATALLILFWPHRENKGETNVQ